MALGLAQRTQHSCHCLPLQLQCSQCRSSREFPGGLCSAAEAGEFQGGSCAAVAILVVAYAAARRSCVSRPGSKLLRWHSREPCLSPASNN